MIKTRYFSLADEIERDIRSGQWQHKLPGVVAVGKHYGVAPDTVVKAVGVLTERGLVTTHGTRGTFISATAGKRPVYRTLGVVGMALDRFAHPPDADHLLAYEAQVARRGFSLLSLQLPVGTRPVEHLHRLPVDGLLFTSSTLTQELVVALRQEGIPFLSLNRIDRIPGLNWIDYDNEQGLQLCLEQLVEFGHRRIAWVAFCYRLQEHQERMAQAFERWAPTADPALRRMEGDYLKYWRAHGSQAHRVYGQAMARELLALPEPPTAIVCHRDDYALGALETARAMGLSVPGDLSIVTLDIAPGALGATPFFAHASCDGRALMLEALDHLMDQTIQPGTEPIQRLLPYTFFPGPSVAPPDRDKSLPMN